MCLSSDPLSFIYSFLLLFHSIETETVTICWSGIVVKARLQFPAPSARITEIAGGGVHCTYFGYGDVPLGKGIYFQDISIKNGINFHNFGIRNGADLQDFALKYKVGYTFSKNWYKGILYQRVFLIGYTFQKIGIRKGYVFEASMAGPRPKSGQVHPPGELSKR